MTKRIIKIVAGQSPSLRYLKGRVVQHVRPESCDGGWCGCGSEHLSRVPGHCGHSGCGLTWALLTDPQILQVNTMQTTLGLHLLQHSGGSPGGGGQRVEQPEQGLLVLHSCGVLVVYC